MPLPIESCRYKINFVVHDGASPHTQTFTSEIIQTFEDEGNILINGQMYKMQKNGLYFIHGLATHFVSPEDITRYNHSIMHLNIPEIEKLCRNLDMMAEYRKVFTEKGGTFCALSNEDVIKCDSIFLEVHNILSDGDGMKYARLSSVFVKLMKLCLEQGSTEGRQDKFSSILSYISDNALEKISIDDICEKTHISKYHLCRVFKENTGVSIGTFIKNRRLSSAKQYLVKTKMSITEIAYKCCFTDSGFFSKTFSKEFGMSPTEFRKKYKQ